MADTHTMLLKSIIACRFTLYRKLFLHLWLWVVLACLSSSVFASITYATRIDEVTWRFSGSKFSCELVHNINDFGDAVFQREAGESTQFMLKSQSPRMKTGKAVLISKSPAWSGKAQAITLTSVTVRESVTPINIQRKTSERMLAELQKGMELQLVRQPWYGDQSALKVVIPSVGFRKSHSDYLQCLGGLLPVNFKQVEKLSLYYANDDSGLTERVKTFLDKVVMYIEEDTSVKTIYLDGHTDSEGVRSENLLKSQERTEKVVDYLVERGVSPDTIVARWHGERYQVESNQNSRGRAKNRRVTLRLSKELPHTIMQNMEKKAQQGKAPMQKKLGNPPQQPEKNQETNTAQTKSKKA